MLFVFDIKNYRKIENSFISLYELRFNAWIFMWRQKEPRGVAKTQWLPANWNPFVPLV